MISRSFVWGDARLPKRFKRGSGPRYASVGLRRYLKKAHRFCVSTLASLYLGINYFGLSGCASKSTVAINDVMTPYTTLKNVIKKSMPQGVVAESVNGREMTSGYFTPTNFYESGDSKTERVYAKVLILGSSRPFKVEVQCLRERRGREGGKGTYLPQGEDVRLSKQLAQYFRDALADRREDRTLIDDFRPF